MNNTSETTNQIAGKFADLSQTSMAEPRPVWDRPISAATGLPGTAARRVALPKLREAFGGLASRPSSAWKPSAQNLKIKLRATSVSSVAPGRIAARMGDYDHRVTVTAEGCFEYEPKLRA